MSVLPKIPASFQEQSWSDGIIRRGYVRRGYVAEVPGLHPELRFVFEPLLPEPADELDMAMARAKSPGAAVMVVVKKLTLLVKAWSFDEPISEMAMRTLQPSMLNRLRLIVCGRGATDLDPLWTPETDGDPYEPIEETLGN